MIEDNEEKPETCQACQYPAEDLERYDNLRGSGGRHNLTEWYCPVCAGSYISTGVRYGRDEATVLMAIGYCTNMILDELRKLKEN